VNSIVTDDFMKCFASLPEEIRELARRAYRLWRENPSHPGLRFKSIRGHDGLYSVRVGRGWRALGRLDDDTVTWFWIGSHADYEGLIA
jgi:mRNA-degrading endonuclease RelE of RelBE toxin-antitoxin system